MTKEEKEEKAKEIATKIVCYPCMSILIAKKHKCRTDPCATLEDISLSHKCRTDPCATWFDGYLCALKALEEYERA